MDEIEDLATGSQLRVGDVTELRSFVEGFLVDKKIIFDCDAVRSAASATSGKKTKWVGLLFRVPLLTQEAILPLTRWLQYLLTPVAVAASLALILLGHGVFFALHHAGKTSLAALSISQWVTLVALVYLGVFFHELGHASACLRYGARHGEIGIGLYFIYPVFYCNVTDCWSLRRYRRAVVDVSGIYFQLIFGAVCCLAWWQSHNELLAFVVYSTIAGVVLNLNPFFRFDGYWLLTDLTGLPSIHRTCKDLTRYLWKRAFRRPWRERRPEIFETPYRVRWVIVVYSILSGFFTVYIAWRISVVFIPAVYYSFVQGVPMLVEAFRHRDVNREIIGLVFRLLLLSLSCWGLARTVIYFTAQTIRRIWARSANWRASEN
jgi:putative peptide zinc metalloprotease protein